MYLLTSFFTINNNTLKIKNGYRPAKSNYISKISIKRGQVFLSFAYLVSQGFFLHVCHLPAWSPDCANLVFCWTTLRLNARPCSWNSRALAKKKTEPAAAQCTALQACRVCWDLRLQSWVLPASLAPALASWQFRANIPWRAGSSALLSFALRSAAWRLANERH